MYSKLNLREFSERNIVIILRLEQIDREQEVFLVMYRYIDLGK
jgi:hypothetical protein